MTQWCSGSNHWNTCSHPRMGVRLGRPKKYRCISCATQLNRSRFFCKNTHKPSVRITDVNNVNSVWYLGLTKLRHLVMTAPRAFLPFAAAVSIWYSKFRFFGRKTRARSSLIFQVSRTSTASAPRPKMTTLVSSTFTFIRMREHQVAETSRIFCISSWFSANKTTETTSWSFEQFLFLARPLGSKMGGAFSSLSLCPWASMHPATSSAVTTLNLCEHDTNGSQSTWKFSVNRTWEIQTRCLGQLEGGERLDQDVQGFLEDGSDQGLETGRQSSPGRGDVGRSQRHQHDGANEVLSQNLDGFHVELQLVGVGADLRTPHAQSVWCSSMHRDFRSAQQNPERTRKFSWIWKMFWQI